MYYSSRYTRKTANKPSKPIDDNGDFDDIGKAKTAGQYYYNQKKKRGRF